MKKKLVMALLVCSMTATMLAGCGGKEKEDEKASKDSPQKITVAVGSNFKPYVYVDENDQPAGYDVEVLKAVDEKLEQYEFEFQSMDFKNILLSVESNKAQIGSQQFEINEERQKKYLYADEDFAKFVAYLIVSKDNNEVKSLEDLAGKSITLPTADNTEKVINEFNEEHPDNPIEIKWVDNPSREEQVASLENGTWDAYNAIPVVIKEMNEEFGDKIKAVGEPLSVTSSYFLYNKDQKELKEAVDGALKELKEEGKLSEISMDTLGVDITKDDGGMSEE